MKNDSGALPQEKSIAATSSHSSNVVLPKQVSWDEAIISQHDKERGSRMPIDEPKTPFHAAREVPKCFETVFSLTDTDSSYRNGSSLDKGRGVSPSEVEKSLERARQNSDASSGFEEPLSFEAKRRRHYREFKTLQDFRSQGSLDDDDDEEPADAALV
eukprot:TRINITY_DN179380_c0_g1_i1.p1 TRINITY_DN179380_c0_g1~~TRINITY_DN179380_c0_g1_i1.p1  ORF type:complete len:158 (-),score=22.55 TRINITY_DN179380_c0_g1_i1:153-626(-)